MEIAFRKLHSFGIANYLRFDDSNFDVAARLAEWHQHVPRCVYGKFDVNCARDGNDGVACDSLQIYQIQREQKQKQKQNTHTQFNLPTKMNEIAKLL